MLNDLLLTLPITIATVWVLVLILCEAFVHNANLTRWLTAIGFAGIIASIFLIPSPEGYAYGTMLRTGTFTNFSNFIFAVSGLLVVSISDKYLEEEEINFGEYYIILFISTIGMMLMGSAANLSVIFIGLETMSVALYTLAGMLRKDVRSNEAAMKYFLLGSFATGFFLYGIALIYGATGELALPRIAASLQTNGVSTLFWIGLSLLMIGFLFKVSAVPFHQWTPDVYEGSPTTAAAFMSTGSKAAAFSSLIIVLSNISIALPNNAVLQTAFAYIAVATMAVGNITALTQDNLKRMLAYSSIAHAGYMLVGIAAGSNEGYSGVLYYALIYTLMNVGAFGVIAVLERHRTLTNASDYAGLFKQHPLLAGLMAVFMFSLAGLPPFGGFVGKYKVFAAAVEADLTWLAIVGVLASVVSVYYYLRVVIFMFMRDPEPAPQANANATGSFALVAIAVIVFLMGIFPTEVLKLADNAMKVALK
ncbi:MAG: NADH-quinone oxidoreductase subunit N [Rhizobacter sp.]|nr:NADH-quinone oxidoreductase subunit N [Chlorobiales bacterium]